MSHRQLLPNRITLALRNNSRFPEVVDGTLSYIDSTIDFSEAANIHLEAISALNPIIPTGGTFGAFMRVNDTATNLVGNDNNLAGVRITTTDLQVSFDLGYHYERSMAYIDVAHAARDFALLPGRAVDTLLLQSSADFQELYSGSPRPAPLGGFVPAVGRGNSSNRDYHNGAWGRQGYGADGELTGVAQGQITTIPTDLDASRPVGVIASTFELADSTARELARNHTGTSSYDSRLFDITGQLELRGIRPFGEVSQQQVADFPSASTPRNYITQNSAALSLPVFNGDAPYVFRMVFKAAKRPDPVVPAPDAIYNEKLYLPFLSIHDSGSLPTIAQEILGFSLRGTMRWTPVYNIYVDVGIGEQVTFTREDLSGQSEDIFSVDNRDPLADLSEDEFRERIESIIGNAGSASGAPAVAPTPEVVQETDTRVGDATEIIRVTADDGFNFDLTQQEEDTIDSEADAIEISRGADAAAAFRDAERERVRREKEAALLDDVRTRQDTRLEDSLLAKADALFAEAEAYVVDDVDTGITLRNAVQVLRQALTGTPSDLENVITQLKERERLLAEAKAAYEAVGVVQTRREQNNNEGQRANFRVNVPRDNSFKINSRSDFRDDRDDDDDDDDDAGSAGGGSGPTQGARGGATGYASGADGGATGQQDPPRTSTTEYAVAWDAWQLVDATITGITSSVGLNSSTGELDGIYVVEISYNPNSNIATITTAQYPEPMFANYYDGLDPDSPFYRGTHNITVENDADTLVVQFGNMSIIHIDALAGSIQNKGVN